MTTPEEPIGLGPTTDLTVARDLLAESRRALAECLAKVTHCVDQLNDAQLWWRPHESLNSIANLVLHLEGNITQRIHSVIGGAPDRRDRPREFAERQPIPKAELLARLEKAVAGADQVLAGLEPARLLEARRHRGLRRVVDGTVLSVLLRTLTHFGGHTQEIVAFTRIQLGDAYRFTTPEGP